MKPFEQFVVIMTQKDVATTNIIYQFPKLPPNRNGIQPTDSKEGQLRKKMEEDLASIPQFCFPDDVFEVDEDGIPSKQKGESERFSFVLTDSDGTKRFGFCRRLIDTNVATCLCFISKRPWFEFFDQALAVIEGLQKTSSLLDSGPILEKLSSVRVKTMSTSPNGSGEKVSIKLGYYDQIETTVGLGNSEFGDVPFSYLLSSLHVRNVVKVVASVIWERRLIFSSNNLTKLSASVMAIYAALYPFGWQNIFIPILPKNLLHYCCAPMPFIVGIPSSSLIDLESMPLEEIVFIDLDSNQVVGVDAFDNDVDTLPTAATSLLKGAIRQVNSQAKKNNGVYDNQAAARAFLQFWLTIFSNYKTFMTSTSNNESKLDRDAFEASQSKGGQRFLQQFKGSQMFEQWIRSCEEHRPNIFAFEKEADAFQAALNAANNPSESSGSSGANALLNSTTSSFMSLFGSIRNTIKGSGSSSGSGETHRDSLENKEPARDSYERQDTPDTKPIKAEGTKPSVKAAINDILAKYKRKSSNPSVSPNEIKTALQTMEPKGLISEQAMQELKRRLAANNSNNNVNSREGRSPTSSGGSSPRAPKKMLSSPTLPPHQFVPPSLESNKSTSMPQLPIGHRGTIAVTQVGGGNFGEKEKKEKVMVPPLVLPSSGVSSNPTPPQRMSPRYSVAVSTPATSGITSRDIQKAASNLNTTRVNALTLSPPPSPRSLQSPPEVPHFPTTPTRHPTISTSTPPVPPPMSQRRQTTVISQGSRPLPTPPPRNPQNNVNTHSEHTTGGSQESANKGSPPPLPNRNPVKQKRPGRPTFAIPLPNNNNTSPEKSSNFPSSQHIVSSNPHVQSNHSGGNIIKSPPTSPRALDQNFAQQLAQRIGSAQRPMTMPPSAINNYDEIRQHPSNVNTSNNTHHHHNNNNTNHSTHHNTHHHNNTNHSHNNNNSNSNTSPGGSRSFIGQPKSSQPVKSGHKKTASATESELLSKLQHRKEHVDNS